MSNSRNCIYIGNVYSFFSFLKHWIWRLAWICVPWNAHPATDPLHTNSATAPPLLCPTERHTVHTFELHTIHTFDLYTTPYYYYLYIYITNSSWSTRVSDFNSNWTRLRMVSCWPVPCPHILMWKQKNLAYSYIYCNLFYSLFYFVLIQKMKRKRKEKNCLPILFLVFTFTNYATRTYSFLTTF